MTAYFVIFCLLSLLGLLSLGLGYKKYIGALLAIVLFVMAIISGFRSSDVGADYESYKEIFNSFNDLFRGGLEQVFTNDYFFEPGFALLVVFISSFTNSHVLFFLLISLLTSFLMFFSLRRLAIFPLLSVLIFFSYDFFTNYMVAIRFGLATSLGLLVLFFLSEKKYKISFVVILFAMSIHTAALALFLPFVLAFIRFKRVYILYIIVGALIFGYISLGSIIFNSLLPNWVPRLDSAKAYISDQGYGASLGYLGYINIKYLIISILLYVFWSRLEVKVKHFHVMVLFFLSAVVIRVGFHDLGFISGRISGLLGIVEILIVPAIFLLVTNNYRLVFFAVVVYSFFHLWFMLFVRGFSEYSLVLV